jgi:tetratricopeptide (TPR) repeat protein
MICSGQRRNVKTPAIAARCLTELAALDPGNAEAYYRLALTQEEKAAGKDDPLIAVVLNNLALALRQKNDNRSAEPLFRRALAIQESKLGPDRTATATTLNNLGSLLQSIGQLAKRSGWSGEPCASSKRNWGRRVWNWLRHAITWRVCGRGRTALRRRDSTAVLLRSMSLLYGLDDPELATDLVNLGLLLKEMGESAAASASLNRALAIYEKAFGASSPQLRQLRERIGTRER